MRSRTDGRSSGRVLVAPDVMSGGGGWMVPRTQLVVSAQMSGMVAWQLVTVSPGCCATQAQSRMNWDLAVTREVNRSTSPSTIREVVFIRFLSFGGTDCYSDRDRETKNPEWNPSCANTTLPGAMVYCSGRAGISRMMSGGRHGLTSHAARNRAFLSIGWGNVSRVSSSRCSALGINRAAIR